jgi:regulatory protein
VKAATNATSAAIAYLARRDYASQELAAKLRQKGFDDAEITRVIADLVQRRAIDDARYAERFVATHAARGQGPVRIRQALGEAGVAGEHVDAVLEGGPDFVVIARRVRARKFGADLPGTFADKAKQSRFLQYRGFTSEQIRAALRG